MSWLGRAITTRRNSVAIIKTRIQRRASLQKGRGDEVRVAISTVYFRPGKPDPKRKGIVRRNRDEMLVHKDALALALQLTMKG